MPLNRTAKAFPTTSVPNVPKPSGPKRLRPATPSCRGGASSVLRLAQPAAGRLPSTLDLSDWMSHAASVLMPVTGPLAAFNAQPSAAGA